MELFMEFRKSVFTYELHLSVALNISYGLRPKARAASVALQNNGIHSDEECFGFHRVRNTKESRLSADPIFILM